MATKKVSVFLHAYSDGGDGETVFGYDMSEHGYVVIGKGICEVEMLPHAEVVAKQIETLEAVKQSVMAESHAKVVAIEQKIQSLLAITHEVQP